MGIILISEAIKNSTKVLKKTIVLRRVIFIQYLNVYETRWKGRIKKAKNNPPTQGIQRRK